MEATVFSRPILEMYTISLTNSFLFHPIQYIQMPTKVSIITFEEEQIRERDRVYCSIKTFNYYNKWKITEEEVGLMLQTATLLKHICTQGSFSVYSNQPMGSSQKTQIF